MFKNVLVGVNGRPNHRDAIALASHLTDPNGRLTLAHVHTSDLRPSQAIAPGLIREEHEASHTLLEQERACAEVSAELVAVTSKGSVSESAAAQESAYARS
jgi:Universal stress protein family